MPPTPPVLPCNSLLPCCPAQPKVFPFQSKNTVYSSVPTPESFLPWVLCVSGCLPNILQEPSRCGVNTTLPWVGGVAAPQACLVRIRFYFLIKNTSNKDGMRSSSLEVVCCTICQGERALSLVRDVIGEPLPLEPFPVGKHADALPVSEASIPTATERA